MILLTSTVTAVISIARVNVLGVYEFYYVSVIWQYQQWLPLSGP